MNWLRRLPNGRYLVTGFVADGQDMDALFTQDLLDRWGRESDTEFLQSLHIKED